MEGNKHLCTLIERYPQLSIAKESILHAFHILETVYENKHKLMVAGNGGSAADAEHIAAELMKSFVKPRELSYEIKKSLIDIDPVMGCVLSEKLQSALPVIALNGHVALTTAYMNDCDPILCVAQQVNGYGQEGDAFLGISTSGNSMNIIYAAVTAKAKGIKVIGLTGARNSKLSALADVCICVPETETYKIQELHLPIYHCLCLMLEDRFF